LRFTRQLRTAKVDEVSLLRDCEEAGGAWLARTYSKLPAEYENFYKGIQQPIRYVIPPNIFRILANMQGGHKLRLGIQGGPPARMELCSAQRNGCKYLRILRNRAYQFDILL